MLFFHTAFTANDNCHFAPTLITLKLNNSADLCHCRRLLWLAGLEYLRNTRKTACDILGALGTSWQTRKKLTCSNFLTLIDFNTRFGGKIVNIKYRSLLVFNYHLWMLVALMLNHHCPALLITTLLFNTHRLTFNNINKTNKAANFRQNGNAVRIPRIQPLAFLDFRPIFNLHNRTVRDLRKLLKLSSFLVDKP